MTNLKCPDKNLRVRHICINLYSIGPIWRHMNQFGVISRYWELSFTIPVLAQYFLIFICFFLFLLFFLCLLLMRKKIGKKTTIYEGKSFCLWSKKCGEKYFWCKKILLKFFLSCKTFFKVIPFFLNC